MPEDNDLGRRLEAVRRVDPDRRIALLDELLGVCAQDEAGPVCLALLDLAVVPSDERPRAKAPRVIRLIAHLRRRARAGVHLHALITLVKHWHRVPADLHHVVMVAGRGRLAAAAATLAASPDPSERVSVCDLATASGETGLAPALVALFADQDTRVAASAERGLLHLAYIASGVDPQTGERAESADAPSITTEERALVRDSIARVMPRASRERRRPVLLGAMALLDAASVARARAGHGDSLSTWLLSADEEARSAVRNALRLAEGPLVRTRALQWLSLDAYGGAALERLSRARSPGEHEAVLTRAHLMAHPARTRRAGMLGRARRADDRATPWLPDPATVPALSRDARRGLPRFSRATAAHADARRRVLEPLLADPDAAVRHACIASVPQALLPDLCFDPDPRVARSAMLAWSFIGGGFGSRGPERRPALCHDPARERLLTTLARAEHPAVRALARQELDLLAWLNPHTPGGRAAARRRLKTDPAALVADLRAILLTGATDDRIAAILLVRRLGLHADVEHELLALCESGADGPRARVAATALLALAELGSPDATAAVARHVGVSDPRVRANAVEGVGRLLSATPAHPALHTRLIELKDDPNHRVRANALRGLLDRPAAVVEPKHAPGPRIYEPAAVDSLVSMLSDVRPDHRLAAAWLTGRLLPFDGAARLGPRWAEISVRVHSLASDDLDGRVRVRAAQCAGLLRAKLRADAL